MSTGASALHPFAKAADGGPLVVDDELGKPIAGMRYHAGMTAAERVACGRGTAEDLEACEAQNAAWRAWSESADGVAWLSTHNVRVSESGDQKA